MLLWPLAVVVKLWGRSLRMEMPPEDYARVTQDAPAALVIWHNRLFLAAEIYRRYRGRRPMVTLVSASTDGAWLTAFFSLVGMQAARGSSSRLGREAATALVDALKSGCDIGITPDGPRGPCYELKPGVAIVGRRTGAPLLLIGGAYSSAWRLRSWDKFYIPKPFSRVQMRCELVTANQLADRDTGLDLLKERMLALNPDRE